MKKHRETFHNKKCGIYSLQYSIKILLSLCKICKSHSTDNCIKQCSLIYIVNDKKNIFSLLFGYDASSLFQFCKI